MKISYPSHKARSLLFERLAKVYGNRELESLADRELAVAELPLPTLGHKPKAQKSKKFYKAPSDEKENANEVNGEFSPQEPMGTNQQWQGSVNLRPSHFPSLQQLGSQRLSEANQRVISGTQGSNPFSASSSSSSSGTTVQPGSGRLEEEEEEEEEGGKRAQIQ